jgi:hypothetical protein
VKVYTGGAMMVFYIKICFCEFSKTMNISVSQMIKTHKYPSMTRTIQHAKSKILCIVLFNLSLKLRPESKNCTIKVLIGLSGRYNNQSFHTEWRCPWQV